MQTQPLHYEVIPVTPFEQNCSLVWCPQSGDAALIDPGGDPERLLAAIDRLDLTLTQLLLTHGHLDHVGGTTTLAQQCQVPIYGPEQSDQFWFDQLPEQSEMFGFPHTEAFTPDRWLSAGNRIPVGEGMLEVLHCPGHTPGHIVLFDHAGQTAFVGDVLFQGSIGRTDFPQGDLPTLLQAIRDQLFPLGDEVTVVPGHGPQTTIGTERLHNPFLQ